ncbi:hypothetical protein Q8A67_010404 [Cirrhinus molitorella]|uniref:Uncharacterized protein n=1 Tax=Cirrhinus molitorella TaxID=172907 RepID=A0AA88Q403_9TELE|nr:hypothetical protein Q8A67_010404 [Cirrhinus molitorella]
MIKMRGINAPSTKVPNIKKKRLDNRKQWTCPDKLFCPAASYGPCEVKGLSYFWCSNDSEVPVKEDKNHSSPDCQHLLVNNDLRGSASQNQYLPQHTEKFLQKDVSSENMLQTNEFNLEEFRTSAYELQRNISSVEYLQNSLACAGELKKNACSSRKLKRKEDYENPLIRLPKIVPQSQHFLQKNAFSTRRSTRMEKSDEPWSLTPWVERNSEDELIEEVTCIEEQRKKELKKYESFQASARQNVRLPKIEPPKQSNLQKTKYSIKQLKSSVLPFPLLGEKA